MEIRFALSENLMDWLEVAKDVGSIMRCPHMDIDPAFLDYAKRKLMQNNAIMAYDTDKKRCAGIVGFSCHSNSITWLGVKDEYRNQGIGSKLLLCALDNLDHNKGITVNTYPKDYLPGQPARRLYFKHGFIETICNPFYIEDRYEMVELSLLPSTTV